MEGGGQQPESQTARQPDSQITRNQPEDLGALLLLLCAYFGLPVFANNVETKERTLQTPGTLARIAWASTVWHWLDSPYYGPGWWQICLCPMPNLRSTNVHESARCKEDPDEDPVMRLRWFCVADGERGKAGLFSHNVSVVEGPQTSPLRRRGDPVGLTQASR